MSEERLGLGGQEKLRDTDPENPRTAAEWAVKCLLAGHVPQSPGPQIGYMCENCAESYACEQVAAALRPFCDCGESAAGGTHHARGCIYNRVVKAGAVK